MGISLTTLVPLTILTEGVQANRRALWERDGYLYEGTLRHFCRDTDGRFFLNEDDVMDGFVRITTVQGFEAFLPIREVVELMRDQLFVVQP